MKLFIYLAFLPILLISDLEKVIPFKVEDYLGKQPMAFEKYCLKNDFRYQYFKTDEYSVIEAKLDDIKVVVFFNTEDDPVDLIFLYYDKNLFQKDSICDILDSNLGMLMPDGEERTTMWVDYPEKKFIYRLEEVQDHYILRIKEGNP